MMIAPPRKLSSERHVSSRDPSALAPAPRATKTVEKPRTKQALNPSAPARARMPTDRVVRKPG